jgi:hypothetical protein
LAVNGLNRGSAATAPVRNDKPVVDAVLKCACIFDNIEKKRLDLGSAAFFMVKNTLKNCQAAFCSFDILAKFWT